MGKRTDRREFLKTSAVIGAGYFAAAGLKAEESKSALETVRFACIGVGGKGDEDSNDANKPEHNAQVVAFCDVDEKMLNAATKRFASAKAYTDFRKLLDEMGKEIDAVTISTPDHMHAPIAAMAISMGKHCYCQKPLTRTIYEARRLGEIARDSKVVTQMGNQHTDTNSLREAAAVVQSGVLGKVIEVHVWTNRPKWPQGGPRPPKGLAPPPGLHWDLWLGVAPYRDFFPGAYHDFKWRGWWDFGTGALGDMACHTFNMPYMGLDLRNPTSVVAETSGHEKDSFPAWSVIMFEFPANDKRDGIKCIWYDGGKLPPRELFDDLALELDKEGKKENVPAGSGSLIIGDQGKLYAPGDYAGRGLRMSIGKEKPKVDWIHSPGHFKEFTDAIRGGPTPTSNFPGYGGPLTETILLGNLAVWAAPEAGTGKKIEWDAKNLVATNAPEVMSLVKPTYRDGYQQL
jgi:predicted dehydrogenase